MSIMAVLSVILGIIAIIVFIWSINSMDSSSKKGKKKNSDSSIIGMLVGLVLFFVALGIYDGSGGEIFSSSDSSQEESSSSSSRGSSSGSSKNDAQREVEEAQRGASQSYDSSAVTNSSSSAAHEPTDKNEETSAQSTPVKVNDKNLEKQQEAYKKWYSQVEGRLQEIDTIWSALWTENSTESIAKLTKSLESEKTQFEAMKIPTELSAIHQKRLSESFKRYIDWIESRLKVCQMYSSGSSQQDMTNELARGDGLKLRSNVEISNIGRELGLSN